MQSGFAESAINGSHRVFGYRLKPLCAAHLLLLEAIESPVVGNSDCRVDVSDLIFAAKVCRQNPKLIGGAWGVSVPSLSAWDLVVYALCKFSPAYFYAQVRAWGDYWADYLTTPKKYETEVEGALLSSPAIFASVVKALPMLGERRAWSMPYGLLRTMLEVSDELSGASIRFEPDEKEEARILAELEAAEKAGQELLKSWESENG